MSVSCCIAKIKLPWIQYLVDQLLLYHFGPVVGQCFYRTLLPLSCMASELSSIGKYNAHSNPSFGPSVLCEHPRNLLELLKTYPRLLKSSVIKPSVKDCILVGICYFLYETLKKIRIVLFKVQKTPF